MIDASFLGRCSGLAVCTWSDALDRLAINGVLRGIRQRGGHGRFAGRAVTVKETVGYLGAYPKGEFAVGRIVDSVGPGDVLVVDMGGAEVSTMGGNAALAIKRNGAAAVIIDGACRDLDEIARHGLWVASRHTTPITGKTRVKVESVGEPVVAGGVTIRAGDIVIGDETGIIVVPSERAEEALAVAEDVQRTDRKLEDGLKAGLSFSDAARAANYL